MVLESSVIFALMKDNFADFARLLPDSWFETFVKDWADVLTSNLK